MTTQDGLPDPEQPGSHHRRRSPYDELGLAVDLFDSPTLLAGAARSAPAPRETSTGSYSSGAPASYATPGTGDDTERFIESLRADEDPDADPSWGGDPRGGRGRHADAAADEPTHDDDDDNAFGDQYAATRHVSPERRRGASAEAYRTTDSGHDLLAPLRDLADDDLPYQRGAVGSGDLHVERAPDKPTSVQLTAETVLRRRAELPAGGWRRAIYGMTAGRINPGPSKAEIRERELMKRARTPLRGCHRLAVISLKGGVGKTTTTACLGSMFATLRGDRVVAMDANPDRGTLGEKVPRTSAQTVRDLVNNAALLTRYAEVREFTSQAPSRLEVLASDADPFASLAFSETDYRVGVGILESYYNLILTDCGTGLLHSAMVGVLGLADSLIVVSSPSLDGARSASATLDWLEHHGYHSLVRTSVAVISTVHPNGGNVDVGKLEDHFGARCRAVVRVPFDPHLEEGGVIELAQLERATYDAYLQLAAAVGGGFATSPLIG